MLSGIHAEGSMTHMPFLTTERTSVGSRADAQSGTQAADGEPRRVLFYCHAAREDRELKRYSPRWKLWCLIDGDKPRRIETGLSEDRCECSPTAWHGDTGWNVCFVAGGAKANPRYHLYRMDGPTLDRLGAPVAVCPTRAGFVFGDRLVHTDMANLIHVRRLAEPARAGVSADDFDIELPGAFIYRVAYRTDAPDTLLISGQWQAERDVFTLEYDLATGDQHLLECDSRSAYKCTILGDEVFYAERFGEHFEDRRISAPAGLSRRPTSAAVRRLPGEVQPIATEPMRRCGCRGSVVTSGALVTRPSCLECVEKHLGAAYVLLTETRDGYAHRLRAIGHLHEAEDESQEWPDLHAVIRAARRAYQTDGTVPEWEHLAEVANGVPSVRSERSSALDLRTRR